MPDIRIAGREIGRTRAPFIIAEMSGNHNQSLERALAIVDAAAASGAHALKIQTYTADTMTLDLTTGDFRIDDPQSLWVGRSLYELYEDAHTPWEWHSEILDRCRARHIIGFSTPFDETAVDFLEDLDVPCYKIASFENTDLPLIRRVARTGKPMLISTGMATESELAETIQAARDEGCVDLVLLKCTSAYPAPFEAANLRTIPEMRDRYGVEVGLSDHTPGLAVPLAAVTLGASVVEKHFTLLRSDGGVDAAFSLEPDELRVLVTESLRAWQSLGKVSYGATEHEKKSLQFRRSLYVTADMKKGDVFSTQNLRAIRPGFGLPPKHYEQILGRAVRCDVKKGTPMNWELVE
jgi:pseudaminic acid synthase